MERRLWLVLIPVVVLALVWSMPWRQPTVLHGIVLDKAVHQGPGGTAQLMLRDREGQVVKVAATKGLPTGIRQGVRVSVQGEFSLEHVFLAEKVWVYHIDDPRQEER